MTSKMVQIYQKNRHLYQKKVVIKIDNIFPAQRDAPSQI